VGYRATNTSSWGRVGYEKVTFRNSTEGWSPVSGHTPSLVEQATSGTCGEVDCHHLAGNGRWNAYILWYHTFCMSTNEATRPHTIVLPNKHTKVHTTVSAHSGHTK
jgi:hypothetical protein